MNSLFLPLSEREPFTRRGKCGSAQVGSKPPGAVIKPNLTADVFDVQWLPFVGVAVFTRCCVCCLGRPQWQMRVINLWWGKKKPHKEQSFSFQTDPTVCIIKAHWPNKPAGALKCNKLQRSPSFPSDQFAPVFSLTYKVLREYNSARDSKLKKGYTLKRIPRCSENCVTLQSSNVVTHQTWGLKFLHFKET